MNVSRYTIQLRGFEDVLGYHQLAAEIEFSVEVPLNLRHLHQSP
ncbi:MAG: hypothetical protein OXP71_01365 [Candidatus Poribacteria bacterium]|nr:hypothetical protein [Candidatus Poribacteria bacterium]